MNTDGAEAFRKGNSSKRRYSSLMTRTQKRGFAKTSLPSVRPLRTRTDRYGTAEQPSNATACTLLYNIKKQKPSKDRTLRSTATPSGCTVRYGTPNAYYPSALGTCYDPRHQVAQCCALFYFTVHQPSHVRSSRTGKPASKRPSRTYQQRRPD